jgi:hypothetical protein
VSAVTRSNSDDTPHEPQVTIRSIEPGDDIAMAMIIRQCDRVGALHEPVDLPIAASYVAPRAAYFVLELAGAPSSAAPASRR